MNKDVHCKFQLYIVCVFLNFYLFFHLIQVSFVQNYFALPNRSLNIFPSPLPDKSDRYPQVPLKIKTGILAATKILVANRKKPCTYCTWFYDPYGIRTRVTAVKGRCLNRLTKGPNGSAGRIRTYDRSVNSRVLYH